MTLYADLLDLLDLVGSRDCIHGGASRFFHCGDELCEPCAARELHHRMTSVRDRLT